MELRKMFIVAGWSLACFGACGSEEEPTKSNANRGGAGSSASRAPECPAERPMMPRSPCEQRGQVCMYPQGDCTCNTDTMGQFGAIAWDCPVNFRAQMCPMTAPNPGGTCQTVFGECNYGADKICDCADDTNTWACWNPADCPDTPPMNQSACDPVGMECEYDDQNLDCDCTSMGWDCD